MADVIKQYSIKINADAKDAQRTLDGLANSAKKIDGIELDSKFADMEEKIRGHVGKLTQKLGEMDKKLTELSNNDLADGLQSAQAEIKNTTETVQQLSQSLQRLVDSSNFKTFTAQMEPQLQALTDSVNDAIERFSKLGEAVQAIANGDFDANQLFQYSTLEAVEKRRSEALQDLRRLVLKERESEKALSEVTKGSTKWSDETLIKAEKAKKVIDETISTMLKIQRYNARLGKDINEGLNIGSLDISELSENSREVERAIQKYTNKVEEVAKEEGKADIKIQASLVLDAEDSEKSASAIVDELTKKIQDKILDKVQKRIKERPIRIPIGYTAEVDEKGKTQEEVQRELNAKDHWQEESIIKSLNLSIDANTSDLEQQINNKVKALNEKFAEETGPRIHIKVEADVDQKSAETQAAKIETQLKRNAENRGEDSLDISQHGSGMEISANRSVIQVDTAEINVNAANINVAGAESMVVGGARMTAGVESAKARMANNDDVVYRSILNRIKTSTRDLVLRKDKQAEVNQRPSTLAALAFNKDEAAALKEFQSIIKNTKSTMEDLEHSKLFTEMVADETGKDTAIAKYGGGLSKDEWQSRLRTTFRAYRDEMFKVLDGSTVKDASGKVVSEGVRTRFNRVKGETAILPNEYRGNKVTEWQQILLEDIYAKQAKALSDTELSTWLRNPANLKAIESRKAASPNSTDKEIAAQYITERFDAIISQVLSTTDFAKLAKANIENVDLLRKPNAADKDVTFGERFQKLQEAQVKQARNEVLERQNLVAKWAESMGLDNAQDAFTLSLGAEVKANERRGRALAKMGEKPIATGEFKTIRLANQMEIDAKIGEVVNKAKTAIDEKGALGELNTALEMIQKSAADAIFEQSKKTAAAQQDLDLIEEYMSLYDSKQPLSEEQQHRMEQLRKSVAVRMADVKNIDTTTRMVELQDKMEKEGQLQAQEDEEYNKLRTLQEEQRLAAIESVSGEQAYEYVASIKDHVEQFRDKSRKKENSIRGYAKQVIGQITSEYFNVDISSDKDRAQKAYEKRKKTLKERKEELADLQSKMGLTDSGNFDKSSLTTAEAERFRILQEDVKRMSIANRMYEELYGVAEKQKETKRTYNVPGLSSDTAEEYFKLPMDTSEYASMSKESLEHAKDVIKKAKAEAEAAAAEAGSVDVKQKARQQLDEDIAELIKRKQQVEKEITASTDEGEIGRLTLKKNELESSISQLKNENKTNVVEIAEQNLRLAELNKQYNHRKENGASAEELATIEAERKETRKNIKELRRSSSIDYRDLDVAVGEEQRRQAKGIVKDLTDSIGRTLGLKKGYNIEDVQDWVSSNLLLQNLDRGDYVGRTKQRLQDTVDEFGIQYGERADQFIDLFMQSQHHRDVKKSVAQMEKEGQVDTDAYRQQQAELQRIVSDPNQKTLMDAIGDYKIASAWISKVSQKKITERDLDQLDKQGMLDSEGKVDLKRLGSIQQNAINTIISNIFKEVEGIDIEKEIDRLTGNKTAIEKKLKDESKPITKEESAKLTEQRDLIQSRIDQLSTIDKSGYASFVRQILDLDTYAERGDASGERLRLELQEFEARQKLEKQLKSGKTLEVDEETLSSVIRGLDSMFDAKETYGLYDSGVQGGRQGEIKQRLYKAQTEGTTETSTIAQKRLEVYEDAAQQKANQISTTAQRLQQHEEAIDEALNTVIENEKRMAEGSGEDKTRAAEKEIAEQGKEAKKKAKLSAKKRLENVDIAHQERLEALQKRRQEAVDAEEQLLQRIYESESPGLSEEQAKTLKKISSAESKLSYRNQKVDIDKKVAKDPEVKSIQKAIAKNQSKQQDLLQQLSQSPIQAEVDAIDRYWNASEAYDRSMNKSKQARKQYKGVDLAKEIANLTEEKTEIEKQLEWATKSESPELIAQRDAIQAQIDQLSKAKSAIDENKAARKEKVDAYKNLQQFEQSAEYLPSNPLATKKNINKQLQKRLETLRSETTTGQVAQDLSSAKQEGIELQQKLQDRKNEIIDEYIEQMANELIEAQDDFVNAVEGGMDERTVLSSRKTFLSKLDAFKSTGYTLPGGQKKIEDAEKERLVKEYSQRIEEATESQLGQILKDAAADGLDVYQDYKTKQYSVGYRKTSAETYARNYIPSSLQKLYDKRDSLSAEAERIQQSTRVGKEQDEAALSSIRQQIAEIDHEIDAEVYRHIEEKKAQLIEELNNTKSTTKAREYVRSLMSILDESGGILNLEPIIEMYAQKFGADATRKEFSKNWETIKTETVGGVKYKWNKTQLEQQRDQLKPKAEKYEELVSQMKESWSDEDKLLDDALEVAKSSSTLQRERKKVDEIKQEIADIDSEIASPIDMLPSEKESDEGRKRYEERAKKALDSLKAKRDAKEKERDEHLDAITKAEETMAQKQDSVTQRSAAMRKKLGLGSGGEATDEVIEARQKDAYRAASEYGSLLRQIQSVKDSDLLPDQKQPQLDELQGKLVDAEKRFVSQIEDLLYVDPTAFADDQPIMRLIKNRLYDVVDKRTNESLDELRQSGTSDVADIEAMTPYDASRRYVAVNKMIDAIEDEDKQFAEMVERIASSTEKDRNAMAERAKQENETREESLRRRTKNAKDIKDASEREFREANAEDYKKFQQTYGGDDELRNPWRKWYYANMSEDEAIISRQIHDLIDARFKNGGVLSAPDKATLEAYQKKAKSMGLTLTEDGMVQTKVTKADFFKNPNQYVIPQISKEKALAAGFGEQGTVSSAAIQEITGNVSVTNAADIGTSFNTSGLATEAMQNSILSAINNIGANGVPFQKELSREELVANYNRKLEGLDYAGPELVDILKKAVADNLGIRSENGRFYVQLDTDNKETQDFIKQHRITPQRRDTAETSTEEGQSTGSTHQTKSRKQRSGNPIYAELQSGKYRTAEEYSDLDRASLNRITRYLNGRDRKDQSEEYKQEAKIMRELVAARAEQLGLIKNQNGYYEEANNQQKNANKQKAKEEKQKQNEPSKEEEKQQEEAPKKRGGKKSKKASDKKQSEPGKDTTKAKKEETSASEDNAEASKEEAEASRKAAEAAREEAKSKREAAKENENQAKAEEDLSSVSDKSLKNRIAYRKKKLESDTLSEEQRSSIQAELDKLLAEEQSRRPAKSAKTNAPKSEQPKPEPPKSEQPKPESHKDQAQEQAQEGVTESAREMDSALDEDTSSLREHADAVGDGYSETQMQIDKMRSMLRDAGHEVSNSEHVTARWLNDRQDAFVYKDEQHPNGLYYRTDKKGNAIVRDNTPFVDTLKYLDTFEKKLANLQASDKVKDFQELMPSMFRYGSEEVSNAQDVLRKFLDMSTRDENNQAILTQAEVKELNAQLDNALSTVKRYTSGKGEKMYVEGFDIKGGFSTARAEMEAYVKSLDNATASIQKFNNNEQELTYTIRTADNMLETHTVSVEKNGKMYDQMVQSTKYLNPLQQAMSGLGAKFREIFNYVIASTSIYQVINMMKQAVSMVTEMDTAMTNLRKVAEGTTEEFNNFKDASYGIAKEAGSTATAVVDAATEWARLGYSLAESQKLARTSIIYSNVGELDATTATTDLVSALKAFDIEAENAMHVVDVMNEIGNNYAISSAQIGEVLEKSSSALAVSGDDLEHVTAMAAAMNEVLQDSSVTGSTLKVVGLRLRGAKTELTSMDEDTEGMATSTSKLRAKVMGLTNVDGQGGFDIMKDPKNFKTTYDIMQGIAKVWDKMSQIDQAALLELIAGKNRAQGAAALISNFATAERALQDAYDAEGSAERENEKYLDSIQGKMQQFQTQLQAIANTTIDSEGLKVLVDIGTALLSIVNDLIGAFGGLSTIIGGLAAAYLQKTGSGLFSFNKDTGFKTFFDGFKKEAQSAAVVVTKETEGIIGNALENLSGKTIDEKFNWSGFFEANNVKDKMMQSFLQDETIETKNLQTYIEYVDKVKQSTSGLGAAFGKAGSLITGFLSSLAMTIAISVAITAVFKGIQLLLDKTIFRSQRIIEAGEKAKKSIEEITKAYQTQKDAVDEFDAEKYQELYEKNQRGALSTEEFKEFADINNQLADIFPELVQSYDEQGNAILSLGDSAETATEKLKEMLHQEQQIAEFKVNEELGVAARGVFERVDQLSKDISKQDEIIKVFGGIKDETSLFNTSLLESGLFDIKVDPHDTELRQTVLRAQQLFEQAVYDNGGLLAETPIYGDEVPDSKTNEVVARFSVVPQFESEKDFELAMQEYQALLEEHGMDASGKNREAQMKRSEDVREIKAEWNSIAPSIISQLGLYEEFDKLPDELQQRLRDAITQMDIAQLTKEERDSLIKDPRAFVRGMFLDPIWDAISNSQGEIDEAKKKIFDQLSSFDGKDETSETYKASVNSLIEQLTKDEEVQKQIRMILHFTYEDENGQEAWSVDDQNQRLYKLFDVENNKMESSRLRAQGVREGNASIMSKTQTVSQEIIDSMTQEQKDALEEMNKNGELGFDPKTIIPEELFKRIDRFIKKKKEASKPEPVNELSDIFNSETYSANVSDYETKLSSAADALEKLRTEGSLTSDEMMKLQETFPDLTDFSLEGISKAGTEELTKWISSLTENWKDMSPEGLEQLDTYVRNLMLSYSDLTVTATDARQAVVDSLISSGGSRETAQFDLNEKLYALKQEYGEDLNWNIILSLKDQFSGDTDALIEKYGNYELYWNIKVLNEEAEAQIERIQSSRDVREAEKSLRQANGGKLTRADYKIDSQISQDIIDQYNTELRNAASEYMASKRTKQDTDVYTSAYNRIMAAILGEKQHIAENDKAEETLDLVDLENELSVLQNEADQVQSSIDDSSNKGLQITEEQYQKRIDNAEDQIKKNQELADGYAELAKLHKDDEDKALFLEYTEKANQYSNAIVDLNGNIIEWKDNIASIDNTHFSNELTQLQNKAEDLQRELTDASIGEKAVIYVGLQLNSEEQKKNLLAQRQEIVDDFNAKEAELGDGKKFEFDDPVYQQYLTDLRNVDTQLQQLTDSQLEWANALLNTPMDAIIEQIEKYENELQNLQDDLAIRQAKGGRKTAQDYLDEEKLYKKEIRSDKILSGLYDVEAGIYSYFGRADLAKQAKENAEQHTHSWKEALANLFTSEKERKELPLQDLNDELVELQNAASDTQRAIDATVERGEDVSSEQYQSLIDNAESQINIQNSIIKENQNLLSSLGDARTDENAEYWDEYTQNIQNAKDAILQLTNAQIAWIQSQQEAAVGIPKINREIATFADRIHDVKDKIARDEFKYGKASDEDHNALASLYERDAAKQQEAANKYDQLAAISWLPKVVRDYFTEQANSAVDTATQDMQSALEERLAPYRTEYNELQRDSEEIQREITKAEQDHRKISKKTYQELIANGKQQIRNMKQQQQEIGAMNDEWWSLQNSIDSMEDSIYGWSSSIDTIIYDQAAQLASTISTAISESMSETGLTTETINALVEGFSDLTGKNLDVSDIFYNTADGVKVNTQALQELTEAEYDMIAANLADEIQTIKDKMSGVDEGSTVWNAYNDQLERLMQTQAQYFAQFQEMQKALSYNNAIDLAESTSNAGANYDKNYDRVKTYKEARQKGLIGTDEFKAWTAYLDVYGRDTLSAYDAVSSKIDRYFTENAQTGLTNFLNDMKALGYAAQDANGAWTLSIDDYSAAAKDMQMGSEWFMDTLTKLEDFGMIHTYVSSLTEAQLKTQDIEGQIAQAVQTYNEMVRRGASDEEIQKQIEHINKLEAQWKSLDSVTKRWDKTVEANRRKDFASIEERLAAQEKLFSEADTEAGREAARQAAEAIVKEFGYTLDEEAKKTGVFKLSVEAQLDYDERTTVGSLDNPAEAELFGYTHKQANSGDLYDSTVSKVVEHQEEVKGLTDELSKYTREELLAIGHADGAWSDGEKELEQLCDTLDISYENAGLLVDALAGLGLIKAPDLIDKIPEALADGRKEVEKFLESDLGKKGFRNLDLDEDVTKMSTQALANRAAWLGSLKEQMHIEEGSYADQFISSKIREAEVQLDIQTRLDGSSYSIGELRNMTDEQLATEFSLDLNTDEGQAKLEEIHSQLESMNVGYDYTIHVDETQFDELLNTIVTGELPIRLTPDMQQVDSALEETQNTDVHVQLVPDNVQTPVAETDTQNIYEGGGSTEGYRYAVSKDSVSQQDVSEINNATQAIQDEGSAAAVAAEQKQAFIEANNALAGSGDGTALSLNNATTAIQSEGQAASGAIQNLEQEAANSNPTITPKVEESAINTFLSSIGQRFKNAFAALQGKQTIEATTVVNNSQADEAMDQETKNVEGFSKVTGMATVDVNTTGAMAKIAMLKDALASISGIRPMPIIDQTSIGNAISRTQTLINKLNEAATKQGGLALGTAHATGTTALSHAYASGKRDWTVGKNESALVNEIGQESRVRDGVWELIPGGPHVEDLRKDDIIFNAEQTADLIRTGKTARRGKLVAHAKGTVNGMSAHYDTTTGKTVSGFTFQGVTSTSNQTSSNTSAAVNTAANKVAKKTKKALDQLNKWLEKLFDWIEVRLDRIQRRIDLNSTKAENAVGSLDKLGNSIIGTISSNKNSFVDAAMKQIANSASDFLNSGLKLGSNGQVVGYTGGFENTLYGDSMRGALRYQQQADAVASKAFSLGIFKSKSRKSKDAQTKYMNDIISRIQKGTIDITQYDEKIRKFIESYSEWYNKSQDLVQSTEELKQQYKELQQTKLDNITEEYETLIDLYDAQKSTSESWVNYLKAFGENVNTGDRKQLLRQRSLQNDTLAALQNERNDYAKELENAAKLFGTNSNEYRAAQKTLEDIDKNIIDTRTGIIETNHAINELAFTVREFAINRLQTLVQKISTIASLAEKRGTNVALGYYVSENTYSQQIDINQQLIDKYYEQIENKRQELLDAIQNDGLRKDSELYQTETGKIANWENQILSLLSANEDLKKSMRDLRWKGYNELHKQLDTIKSDFDHIQSFIRDGEILDDDGALTDRGFAKITLIGEDMLIAEKNIANAKVALDKLDEELKNGVINLETYNEEVDQQIDLIQDNASALQDYQEQLASIKIDQMEKQNDALQKLIQARKEALNAKKEYYDWDKTLKSKNKDIAQLQAQINALNGVTNDAAIARRTKLQAQLQEAQEDLNDTLYEHSIEIQQEGYDRLSEDMQEALDNAIKLINGKQDALQQTADAMLAQLKTNNVDEKKVIEGIVEDRATMIHEETKSTLNQDIGTVVDQLGVGIAETVGENVNGIAADKVVSGIDTALDDYYVADDHEILDGILKNVSSIEKAISSNENINTIEKESDTQQEADEAAVQAVADAINSLKDSKDITLNDKSSITSIYKMIEALSQNQSDMLDDSYIERLSTASSTISQLEKLGATPTQNLEQATAKAKEKQAAQDTIADYEKQLQSIRDKQNAFIQRSRVNGDVYSESYNLMIKSYDSQIASITNAINALKTKYNLKKGTKNLSKDILAWTNEDWDKIGSEMIIRKQDNAILTPLKANDSVIPANLADNLFKWGAISPDKFITNPFVGKWGESGGGSVSNSDVTSNMSQTVEMHFDSLFHIEGNVDESVMPRLENLGRSLVNDKDFQKNVIKFVTKDFVRESKKQGIR